MKEALFYKKLKDKKVQCLLCPHFCTLKKNESGKCRVRKNKDGKLFSLVYGRPCSLAFDPIEKKPLYHFFPGQTTFSIATVGCNLNCKHCQNWEISQAEPIENKNILEPKEIIKEVKKNKIKVICYTYTEPTIFYEYMLVIARLAKNAGIKNVVVSNGFINPRPLKKLCKYIDAANIDLKSIEDKFYREVCDARVEPVLETLKILKKEKIWTEITNLLIPGLNDSEEQIKNLVVWIKDNLGRETPIHFTAFYPGYKLFHLPPAPIEILKKAREIALKEGMKYVYTGNLPDEGNSTFCPKCGNTVIKRRLFSIIENNLKQGRCGYCNSKISGFWEIKN